MNKKLLIAMATLLGFSTACSSVKNTPKGGSKAKNDSDILDKSADGDTSRRIVVMYGVRRPIVDTLRSGKVETFDQPQPNKSKNSRYEVDPVAEKPRDE